MVVGIIMTTQILTPSNPHFVTLQVMNCNLPGTNNQAALGINIGGPASAKQTDKINFSTNSLLSPELQYNVQQKHCIKKLLNNQQRAGAAAKNCLNAVFI